jgi:hypothetical protein
MGRSGLLHNLRRPLFVSLDEWSDVRQAPYGVRCSTVVPLAARVAVSPGGPQDGTRFVECIGEDSHRNAARVGTLQPRPEDANHIIVVPHGVDAGGLELRDRQVRFEAGRVARHVAPTGAVIVPRSFDGLQRA